MNRLYIFIVVLFFFFLYSIPVYAENQSDIKSKSKNTALLYSLGSTLVPLGVGATFMYGNETIKNKTFRTGVIISGSGFLIGPGIGHLYAKNRHKFLTGILLRSVSAGVASLELLLWSNTSSWDSGSEFEGFFVVVGSITFLISMVYDISTVGRSVNAYNEKLTGNNVSFIPCYDPRSGQAGITLTMSF